MIDLALFVIDAIICAAICLRVLFFRKNGAAHRPLAALIAWVIVCASGAVALQALLGLMPVPKVPDVILHAVLCLAVFASRGNITELFHTASENVIYRTVRRSHHAQG